MRFLIGQLSKTQRLVIQSNPNGSWLLSKEWRKLSNQPWIQGKGITLPNFQNIPQRLGKLLHTGASDFEILEEPNVSNVFS